MKLQYKLYLIAKTLEAGDIAFDELKINGATNLGNVKNDLDSYRAYEPYGLKLEKGSKEYKAVPISGMLYTNQLVSIALNRIKNIDKEVFNKLGQLFINNIFLDACFKVLNIPINHNQNFEEAKRQVLEDENETVITDKTRLKNGYTVTAPAISQMKKFTISILNTSEKGSIDSFAERIKEIIVRENARDLRDIEITVENKKVDEILNKIDKYISEDYKETGVEDVILKDGIKIINQMTKSKMNENFDYYMNMEPGDKETTLTFRAKL